MTAFAEFIDRFYQVSKGTIFRTTKRSPEAAHGMLTQFLRSVYHLKLHLRYEKKFAPEFFELKISNAAGFNKNGEIPPCLLRLAGFDRVVIGTVTKYPNKGNSKPRVWRFEDSQSMVNWMGLPNKGSRTVRNFLNSYAKDQNPPGTLNVAPTPKQGMSFEEKMKDLKYTIECMQDVEWIDRIEWNLSCPNTFEQQASDAEKFKEELRNSLQEICPVVEKNNRKLYLKISPDMEPEFCAALLEAIEEFPVTGITACNTSVRHDPERIVPSPGIGGASGEAVYSYSRKVQDFLAEHADKRTKIIGCGGINTRGKAEYLKNKGIREIQIYTPLIFQGFTMIQGLKS